MKKIFTCIVTVVAVVGFFSVHAQTARKPDRAKPESRPMELNPLFKLRNVPVETRSDYVPFPDSTITYDLKGEPITIARYEYNDAGDETSYRNYEKDLESGEWIETEKRIRTYDSAGKSLTGETSRWNKSKQMWTGDNKWAYTYDSQGRMLSYEGYDWDVQSNAWKGTARWINDYKTGNTRMTVYNWDTNTKSWIPYQRTELAPSYNLEEDWNSSEGKWDWLRRIESKRVVNYSKLGMDLQIDEERWFYKDDQGNWNKEGVLYIRFSNRPSGWSGWNYATYNLAYDNAKNITSVTFAGYDGNTLTFSFTYDYNMGKVNSNSVYKNGALADNKNWVYDDRGRTIEESRNMNHEDRKDDYKYAYTYIGDSDVYNSIEYYLWDNSKQTFVKDKKNMYIRNEDGKNTMHQTYSWAETKWVLSSYTIYYPNDYTSDLEFEETGSVGKENKGSFEVGFNLPQDAEVSGSFYITFPQGFVLDTENTLLSEELSGKYSITITPQEEENTWFVEIKELPANLLSGLNASSYKKILTVAYKVDEELPKGDYNAEIKDLHFFLSDGTVLIEQEREVGITVERYGTAMEQTTYDAVRITVINTGMEVFSPEAEQIKLYNISGQLVCTANKPAGNHIISTADRNAGVYILTGSTGWSAKVLINK